MARCFLMLALLCSLPLVAGCLVAPVIPPLGALYTDMSAPLDNDLQGQALGSKKGTGETTSILGMVTWGDASVATAAEQAGILKVNHVDYDFLNILGVYQRFTVVVHGD